ncbi:MAG: hypothetical protein GTO45_38990 [Candidatus Aminicenantes bacterium]|nr:hypothetical protein [Candidatus Aminicenantes bacterium]NIM84611.1 hypothetical protein [Candidatus Aminicenantes bacterium]NIN24133.1 hypothetical protein [Candidatus Aminicenantes bacterium]NIN47839.1 hypothetical protein [Candidatus Aminicenantes bacterium]NIN90777.1 hypothetical protein [Candidatus Aminicenantes bacterium]
MRKLMFLMSFSLVVCLVCWVWVPGLQGAWVGNDPPIDGEKENAGVINSLIVDGAANFLDSYSYFLRLLKESEISQGQMDYQKANKLIDVLAPYLEASKANYSTAFSLMKGLNLNPDKLQTLETFDYAGLVARRRLHSDVMNQVAAFLVKGDVKGLYGKMIDDLDRLLKGIEEVREDIKNHISPGIEGLRTLYQQYSDLMQFGYYSSLVFAEIKN